MVIQRLNPHELSDFEQLISIFHSAFEHLTPIPPQEHLAAVLREPRFMAFVIKIQEVVVGGLSLHVLPNYYNTKPMAYLYDVAIKPDFRGLGLGKALMREVCTFCQLNGFDEAYVEAEANDEPAVGFYRQTRPSFETKAVHFTYRFSS